MNTVAKIVHERNGSSFTSVKQNMQNIAIALEQIREQVIELQAELDQSKLDAARYRHLRKGIGFQMSVSNGVNDEGKPRFVHYTFANKNEPEYGVTLDETVDKEIQREKDVANRSQESKVGV